MRSMLYRVRLVCVVVAVAGCLPLCAQLASGSTITNLNVGQSIALSSVLETSGEAVQIGDKLFDNFQFSYTDTDSDPSDDLSASDVTINALQDSFGYGLSLEMPLSTHHDVTKDVVIKFSVLVLDPSQQISGVELGMQASTTGDGLADVSESVYTGGFGAGSIANLDVSSPGSLSTSVQFTSPQSEIWVEKDILVYAGCGCENSAAIQTVEQNFSQVPEPSTWMLVGLGLLGVLECHCIRRRVR